MPATDTLPPPAVAVWRQHRRSRSVDVFRDQNVAGHDDARLGLDLHPLAPVVAAVDFAGHPGTEVCGLHRVVAGELPELARGGPAPARKIGTGTTWIGELAAHLLPAPLQVRMGLEMRCALGQDSPPTV